MENGMAYMSQEKKLQLAPHIKAICEKYGVKASLAVRHHSTLVLNIKSGKLDFIGNYNQHVVERDPTRNCGIRQADSSMSINEHWYREHFTGQVLEFLEELVPAMNIGNHDRSDIQSDYHDVGWYVDIKVGQWDKPYQLTV
jgi:hypothetical protein